jgi:hypothetical protein
MKADESYYCQLVQQQQQRTKEQRRGDFVDLRLFVEQQEVRQNRAEEDRRQGVTNEMGPVM